MAETQRTELLKIDGEGDGSNNHYTKNSITDNRDNLGNHSEEKENGELQAGFPEKDSGLKISLDESDESFKNGLTLSTLKKDDSGVDFEKSPASTGGQEGPLLSDCSESVSESLTDSAACSCTNSASDAKYEDKSKAIVSDDDQEELPGLDAADSCLESMISKDKCFLKRHSVVRHESMEADNEYIDEDNQEESSTDSAEKRKRRRGNAESSDDDTESDEDVDDEDEDTESKKCSSDSDGEIDVEYNNSKMPKHKWKALLDLRNREFGLSNKTPPNIFREAVTASLQMVQRFELQYKMEYHDGCVNALNFNRIGTLLASGSDDLNIVLWNWVRSRPALVFDSGHRSNVFQAKFMPFSGDCHVVSCARDGQVRLADLSLTGVCKGTKKIAQHKGAAHKLALELDSPHVFLSCGEDALTYEMDLRQEKPNKLVITKENEKKVPLYSIHSNPVNSLEFCVGGRDHYLRIYDKRKIAENVNGGVLKKFCPHHLIDSSIKANVTCACYNYNGTEVLGTYNDEDIYLFNNLDSDGADYIHRYQGHRNNATVKGVNFYGPKSEFIVSGSDCGHVFLWEKETESIVQFMEADDGGVINVLEPHPFAPVLATSGLDSDVKVWAPTAKEPTKLAGLKKVMKKNGHQRQVEQVQETDTIDGQMLWFLMNLHRRRARQEDGSDSSEDSDSDSDGSEEMPDRIQCAQS